MGALLALIPVRDWFYGAIAAAALAAGLYYHHKYQDAVSYAATVKAESAATAAAAQKTIETLTATYNASLTTLKANTDAQLKAAADTHTSDVGRLRALAAARGSDPVLQGSRGTAAEAAAWALRLGTLEQISAGLADALRNDDIAATDCRAERASLNGAK